MKIFEAGESVHLKWRAALDEAKRDMGLMPQGAPPAAIVRLRGLVGIPAHDNDNVSGFRDAAVL